MALTPDQRFRNATDYGQDIGYAAAFPNFHEANYGKGTVGGVYFLRSDAIEWRDVPSSELGDPPLWDIPALFRAANNYASTGGFVGAFPNCHQANYGAGRVFGINLVRGSHAVWRDVPRSALHNVDLNNVPEMLKASADYAANNGFAAAFPTFHRSGSGSNVVYGQILLPTSTVDWRDVYVSDLEPIEKKCCVILCQFRRGDQSLIPPERDADWYRRYFFGRGNGSLAEFYRTAANLRLAIWGRVFGWFDIGHTDVEHGVVQGGGMAQRSRVYDWGIAAARANGVAVDDFPHKIVIVNRHTDFGAFDTLPLAMVMPHAADSDARYVDGFHSYMQHEFGHALGLTHSRGPAGVEDDAYCIMSYARHGRTAPRVIEGIRANSGPGLNVVMANELTGRPIHRVVDVVPDATGVTMTIAAQGYPEREEPQGIRILPGTGHPNHFWISYRHRSRWDNGIEGNSILVHEVWPGYTFGSIITGGRPRWALENVGDSMDAPAATFRITLTGLAAGPLATVHVRRLP